MRQSWKINRRHLLKGAGVSLALPMLDIMGAEKRNAKPPVRYMTVFQPNGVTPGKWNVNKTGSDYEFSEILKPFEALRKDITILSGVDNMSAGDHVGMATAFLAGKMINKPGEFRTLDQHIADSHKKY